MSSLPHTNVESQAIDIFDFADLMGSSFHVPLCYCSMEAAATDSMEGTVQLFPAETLLKETVSKQIRPVGRTVC